MILDYAQTFNLLVSEHTAIDCNFLELVPTLYKEVENRVTLHALCDPAPTNQRRSRSGTPPIVHCAGAAVIRLKVRRKEREIKQKGVLLCMCIYNGDFFYVKVNEAKVNDGVDHMISQNRAEYENLLVKASQAPPSKVTQGCVFADHLIT